MQRLTIQLVTIALRTLEIYVARIECAEYFDPEAQTPGTLLAMPRMFHFTDNIAKFLRS